ncbi:hypothetical protein CEXT_282561 [Caerostris extrusa]|uniref:Uncharacterized protein n=1 Tax=Caerostris extrusa TaxID=172846 RepID=A0AAV4WEL2_CAEEX|nr:hypothetical protein CEXT_282561 [Caerostris extrusa]
MLVLTELSQPNASLWAEKEGKVLSLNIVIVYLVLLLRIEVGSESSRRRVMSWVSAMSLGFTTSLRCDDKVLGLLEKMCSEIGQG